MMIDPARVSVALDRGNFTQARDLLGLLTPHAATDGLSRFVAARYETLAAPGLTTYQTLLDLKTWLGERGHAGLLAKTHLLMAQASPRVDFRVTHVEHAGSLFEALGDLRSKTLADAWEAQVEAELGELEGAEDLARQAREAGQAMRHPEAEALATLVQAVCLRALERPTEAAPLFEAAMTLASRHAQVPIRLHTLAELGEEAAVAKLCADVGLPNEGWGLL